MELKEQEKVARVEGWYIVRTASDPKACVRPACQES